MILFNPSSLNQIAICLYNFESFYQNNYTYMPFLNIFDNSVKVVIPSYDFFLSTSKNDIDSFSSDESNYIFGACENFLLDPIQYYKSIPTFTYSDFISQPQNNVLKTAGSIKIPIVLPYSTTTSFSPFLEAIWRIGIYPFVPFFLYTDINPVNLGGPLFIKTFKISVGEQQPAEIDINFTGGTSLLPPDPGTVDSNNFPFSSDYSAPITTDNSTFTYRQAKTYDCLFGIPKTVTRNPLYEQYTAQTLATYNYQSSTNITDMNLTINNELTEIYTANDGISKNLVDGIKYISLKKRKVEGSINFIASIDLTPIYQNPGQRIQALFMYFGGPFYFPMQNVNIQFFDVKATAPGQYTHSIRFEAFLQPLDVDLAPANTLSYYQFNEFDINFQGLYEPITGALYFDTQSA